MTPNNGPMAGLQSAGPPPEPEPGQPSADPLQLIQQAMMLTQSGDPQALQQVGQILQDVFMMLGGGGGAG